MKENRSVRRMYPNPIQKKYLIDALELFYEEGMNGREIEKIIPVAYSTIYKWHRTFASVEEAKKFLHMKKSPKTSEVKTSQEKNTLPSGNQSPTDKELLAKVIQLQKELEWQRLRADAYDEMIRLAEARFKIQIRKK